MDPGIVVVGAGLGGLRTVERLRANGYQGQLTLVGAERHLPYDRPPLTKQVLRGERDATTLRTDLDALKVHLRLGRTAVSLDPAAHTVTLDDDSQLPYDSAVLAPGGYARTLPGLAQRPGHHVVRTIDDALAIRAAVSPGDRVTVVGGGFIGCEVATSLRTNGAEVDLVELLPHPLSRVLGDEGGQLVEDLLTRHGIRVHTGASVSDILGDGHISAIELSNGVRLPSTRIVAGLGLVPAVDWLDDSGLRLDDGIVCDAAGQTSAPDVYAVGDAARWHQPRLGEHRRVEHWTTTADQAATVAAALTGDSAAELNDVPYFWSDQFDVKIQALGWVDPDDTIHRLDVDGRTVLLYSRDGRLTAAVGFSAAKHVMRMRTLIVAGAPADDAVALLTPN